LKREAMVPNTGMSAGRSAKAWPWVSTPSPITSIPMPRASAMVARSTA
jgi:hypothetical protein